MNTDPFDEMLRSSGDGVAKIESFFRRRREIDIERGDVARCSTFLRAKIDDLLTGAEVHARVRCHDRIESRDLQLSQSLQGCVSIFERIDEQVEMRTPCSDISRVFPVLTWTRVRKQPNDCRPSQVDSASRSLRIADPDLRKPRTMRWQRALQLVELLVLPAAETRPEPPLTNGARQGTITVNPLND
jgi:hypothetical protein